MECGVIDSHGKKCGRKVRNKSAGICDTHIRRKQKCDNRTDFHRPIQDSRRNYDNFTLSNNRQNRP